MLAVQVQVLAVGQEPRALAQVLAVVAHRGRCPPPQGAAAVVAAAVVAAAVVAAAVVAAAVVAVAVGVVVRPGAPNPPAVAAEAEAAEAAAASRPVVAAAPRMVAASRGGLRSPAR